VSGVSCLEDVWVLVLNLDVVRFDRVKIEYIRVVIRPCFSGHVVDTPQLRELSSNGFANLHSPTTADRADSQDVRITSGPEGTVMSAKLISKVIPMASVASI
jgi:hypothetical protein